MKIQFGELKNRSIIVGNNQKMRPTTAIVKKSIFGSIADYFPADNVLDLFAGTGLLGFESISLGSENTYFVDVNIETVKAIKQTIVNLKLDSKKHKVFKLDFRQALKYFIKNEIVFDVIFLDPPFIDNDYWNESLNIIKQNNLLQKNGIIILERPLKKLINVPQGLSIEKEKQFGDKLLLLIKHDSH